LLITEQAVYRPDALTLYFHHPICFDFDCFLITESSLCRLDCF